VKAATEAGLRKELKEFFKGTGVSVRTFKSLKVTETEPEGDPEDEQDVSSPEDTGSENLTSDEPLIPQLNSSGEKRGFIMKMSKEIPVRAEEAGIDDSPEFKKLWMNLIRLVRGGKVDPALQTTEELLQLLQAATPAPEPTPEMTPPDPELASFRQELESPPDTGALEKELIRLRARREQLEGEEIPAAISMQNEAQEAIKQLNKALESHEKALNEVRKRLNKNLDQIAKLEKNDPVGSISQQEQLAEENIAIIENEVESILTQKADDEMSMKENLLVDDFADQQIRQLNRELVTVNREIERWEETLSVVTN